MYNLTVCVRDTVHNFHCWQYHPSSTMIITLDGVYVNVSLHGIWRTTRQGTWTRRRYTSTNCTLKMLVLVVRRRRVAGISKLHPNDTLETEETSLLSYLYNNRGLASVVEWIRPRGPFCWRRLQKLFHYFACLPVTDQATINNGEYFSGIISLNCTWRMFVI